MTEQITDGIHQYKQLMGLIHDPDPMVWNKWWIDETDVKNAISLIVSAAKMSQPFVGMRKTRGRDYDFNANIKRDTFMLLTNGRTDGETATLEKQYKAVYYLLIEPAIDVVTSVDTTDYVQRAQQVVQEVCATFDRCTEYGTYEQAQQAYAHVQRIIQQREAVRLEEKAKNKPKKKAHDALAELFMSLEDDDEVDLFD